MGRFIFHSFQFCFLFYLLAVSYGQENTRGPKRTRTSPYAGLVPFLRTGRSRLQLSLPESDLADESFKRSKSVKTMMAFPRVGRSGTMEWNQEEGWNKQKKSGSNNMNNGLWFGPRLGRIHKRQEYKPDIPLAYLYFGDYTPRLGRESEENLDEVDAIPEEQENDKPVLETV